MNNNATKEEIRKVTLTLEELAMLEVLLVNEIGKSASLLLKTDKKCISKSYFERIALAHKLHDKLKKAI